MNSIQALLGLFFLVGSNGPAHDDGTGLPEVDNTQDAVIIRATSTGCTQKRHFRIVQGPNHSMHAVRLKRDRCRKEPRIVEFRYTHKQMGLQPPTTLDGDRLAGN